MSAEYVGGIPSEANHRGLYDKNPNTWARRMMEIIPGGSAGVGIDATPFGGKQTVRTWAYNPGKDRKKQAEKCEIISV